MYYSIYDKQCGRYLGTGLNSQTRQIAIQEGINYILSDLDDTVYEDDDKIRQSSYREKEQFLEGHELIIEESPKQFPEENTY